MASRKKTSYKPSVFNQNPHLAQDDAGFNSSQCDYSSDVFKEQPSYIIDAQNQQKQFSGQQDMLEMNDQQNSGRRKNGNFNMASPNSHQAMQQMKTVQSSHNSTVKSNIMHAYNQATVQSKQRTMSRDSRDQSLNSVATPYQKSQIMTSCNKKQPLYTMIPNTINKNLNSKGDEIPKASYVNGKCNSALGRPFAQHDSNIKNVNVMFCEESEIMRSYGQNRENQINQVNSQVTITPQKNMPVPMSPQIKPTMTNNSKMNIQPMSKTQVENLQSSSSKKLNSSGQKSTVVYNEFKYFTSCAEIANSQDQKKYVNISNSAIGFQRRSDIQGVQPQNNLNFELSPTDHKIFDMSSPKQSMNSGIAPGSLRASNIRSQMHSNIKYAQDGNFKLQLKTDSPEKECNQYQPEAEVKIRELQSYIEQLEEDLKQSQMRNLEIKKKFKDRSFIQRSLEKSKKHLSDTEDSLILSEKKGKRRNSGLKQGGCPNSSYQQEKNSSHQNHHQQSSSSIVDVKIRPITNLKNSVNGSSLSPQRKRNNQGSFSKCQKIEQSQDSSNILEYQVQDYNDNSNLKYSNINQQDQDSHELEHQPDEECEGCERLKQLVFQAKEAIDDLKLEIEEWRDLCSDKETELRKLQHRIYNDIIGVDKKIEFNEEIQTKEFDLNKPVNVDSKKIRNYISHNKKRIRSRSKSKNGIENSLSQRKSSQSTAQSFSKKSALKNVKDVLNEDLQFYEAEDQGIQTSFHVQSTNDYNTNGSIDGAQEQTSSQNYFSMKSNFSPTSKAIIQHNEENENASEEVNKIKVQNQLYEAEIQRLKAQLSSATKQCESFISLINKAKKKTKQQFNIADIRPNYDISSQIESYSILEKINEWKKEEGLIQQTDPEYDPPASQIPRPMKLLMEIDINELEGIPKVAQTTSNPLKKLGSENVHSELMNLIKHEQEQLRLKQDSKYKELQRQQQEYLSLIQNM